MNLDPRKSTVVVEIHSGLNEPLERLDISTIIQQNGTFVRRWLPVKTSGVNPVVFFWQAKPGRYPLIVSAPGYREEATIAIFARGVTPTVRVHLQPKRTPLFYRFEDLSSEVQKVFDGSAKLIGTTADALYDSLPSTQKATLLNILAKMKTRSIPDHGPVIGAIGAIESFLPNRFYAQCRYNLHKVLEEMVADGFLTWRKVPGALHRGFPSGSFKTLEPASIANLQLTFDATRVPVRMDVDIDIYADFFRHFFGEVVVNHLTDTQTDPYTVYEKLMAVGIQPEYSVSILKPATEKPTVVFVHGWADDNGRFTLDSWRLYFEEAGYQVIELDWGFNIVPIIGQDKRIDRIVEQIPAGAIGLSHSYGCLLLQRASLRGAPLSQLVFLRPAIEPKAPIGPQVQRIFVLHSPLDLSTSVALFFPFLGPKGNMGAVGYRGSDNRFTNVNTGKFGESSSYTHLDLFLDQAKRDFWARQSIRLIQS